MNAVLGTERLIRVYAKHLPYSKPDLDKVIGDMQALGPPTIEVVEYNRNYYAIEGSHRLAAAFELGLVPRLKIVVPESFDPGMEIFWDDVTKKLPHYTWAIP